LCFCSFVVVSDVLSICSVVVSSFFHHLTLKSTSSVQYYPISYQHRRSSTHRHRRRRRRRHRPPRRVVVIVVVVVVVVNVVIIIVEVVLNVSKSCSTDVALQPRPWAAAFSITKKIVHTTCDTRPAVRFSSSSTPFGSYQFFSYPAIANLLQCRRRSRRRNHVTHMHHMSTVAV